MEPGSLGILGGTFNPPHLGHLAIARDALRELALDRVVLMPARMPPHKPVERDPGSAARLAMCRLLVAGAEDVSVCAHELERDGPSYTVDTLGAIHASHPDAELTVIVGADTNAASQAVLAEAKADGKTIVDLANSRGMYAQSLEIFLGLVYLDYTDDPDKEARGRT